MKAGWFWACRHAWRDARAGWRRLLLYVAAIVAGVAALVAIRSFADNLTAGVDTQAKTLLGADLELHRRQPLDADVLALADEFGGERTREVSLGTMAYFPASRDSRLVRLRGVEPAYPFYGVLDTSPVEAATGFQDRDGALVERTLMLQFGVDVGDMIRVGDLTLPVVGALERIPGEVPTASLVGPRVLIPLRLLDSANLLGPGSQARYALQFRLPLEPDAVAERIEEERPRLRQLNLEAETVQNRRRNVGRALDSLYDFLYLAGFASLLLGGIGVGSAMSLHAREKVGAVATLRCLGASRWLPVRAYAVQAGAMAIAGSLAGALLGLLAQRVLPLALDAFLPLPVDFAVSPAAVAEGVVAGVAIAILFAALPLLPLRRVTPLEALRLFADAPAATWRDGWVITLVGLLLAALWLTAWWHTGEADLAAWMLVGLVTVTLVLAATAWLLRRLAHRVIRRIGSYPIRQGVANLYRPRNQTLIVLVTLGFGAFVVGSLLVLRASLLSSVTEIAAAGEADFVLFDLQPDQRAGARDLLQKRGAPVLQDTPIVTMRLAAIGDRPVAEFTREDEVPGWLLRREYNSTYRSELTPTEEVVAGVWSGSADPAAGPVPISLEEGVAADLRVEVGDALTFDVQGVPVEVIVGSVRRVDWEQVSPNFFVVFPAGVLEAAPQQIAMVTRVGSPEASAELQRDLVEAYRNVSVIDLGLVLRTIDDVIAQVRLAIRFMTLFILAAGATVLLVAVRTSRQQRQRESVLLRTLGASRRQILAIQAVEYFALGTLAAATGLLLSTVGGLLLMEFVFETPLVLPYRGLGLTLLVAVGATALVGLWGARGATLRPPLESLRAEL
jgi:putative ABC transport system permease protein